VSCQRPNKPQVFGLYIEGTFEEFMEQSNSYRGLPIHIDSIVNISENEIKIYAYNKTISDLNEDSVIIDSINIDIQLEKEHIRKLSYTIDMPLSEYKVIRFANERIYGNVDYYDISEYRPVCGWRIGKDYMYLNYILSAQQAKYIYIIN
jgi:hypothetical protein